MPTVAVGTVTSPVKDPVPVTSKLPPVRVTLSPTVKSLIIVTSSVSLTLSSDALILDVAV